jgi:glucose/arabinose dehydrogenase
MKLLSSRRLSIALSFIALVTFLVISDHAGVAQQAPAAGQPGAAPQGQGGAQGQGRGQIQVPGAGQGRGGPAANALGEGPWDFGGGRGGRYRVSVVTRGVDRPWGIAFLPGGDMLITERPGRLRVIRNGMLDPTPISGLPKILATGLGGLMDVSLHPQFAQNRLIYLTYSKPHADAAQCPNEKQCSATTAVVRARWDGGPTLSDVKDIIVADGYIGGPGSPRGVGPATGSYGSRLAWDRNGLLYITTGDRNYVQFSQDPMSHNGKILRLRDDGAVPPDNPFVGKAGYKPEIYSLGHRNPLGLYVHPETGELWSTEQGPQGGDELNKIEAGKNYGWALASLGRNYDGTIVGKGFTAPGIEDPVVFWVPAIAVSGLSFYNGDKFPAWKGHAFVGGMRANTGQHIQHVTFNAQGLPTGRELMMGELRQRIREVKPGPDGFIYVLTDEPAGAVLRIEPAPAQ